jgi:hypothetical protein
MNSSLPYIDPTNVDYEEYALALIEKEMLSNENHTLSFLSTTAATTTTTTTTTTSSCNSTRNYDHHDAASVVENTTTTNNTAFDNDEGRTVNPIPATMNDDDNDDDKISYWERSVKRARIQYEQERIRSILLELDKESVMNTSQNTIGSSSNQTPITVTTLTASSQAWQQYIGKVIEPLSQSTKLALQQQQQQVQGINYQRQQHQQEQVGPTIQRLTTQYNDRMRQLMQLKQAVYQLEKSIATPNDIARV